MQTHTSHANTTKTAIGYVRVSARRQVAPGVMLRMAEMAPDSMVEQFSGTTTPEDADNLLRKKFNLQHTLKRQAKGAPRPKPVLWVLSAGHPREVLAACVGVPARQGDGDGGDDWPRGFYPCAPVLTMWVVVLSELPKTPETRLLRMFSPPTMQLEVLAELETLPVDSPEHQPWIDILAEVRYLIEKEPELSPEEKAVMTELRKRWEREKANLRRQGEVAGRAEGEARGEARGEAKGKVEAILTVMKARGLAVSEPTHARLLRCKDLAILDHWLVRAATAASEADVIAA